MNTYESLRAEAMAIYLVEASSEDYNTRAVALATYYRALGAALEAIA
jgi:hypothetical protein